ncbi:MAG: hypothetical protein ABSG37_14550 [Candidatus Limnocylindrales bacterium]|jgi:hypothetical protein
MGHWADMLLPGVKQSLGISGDEQDAEILAYCRQSEAEIELLAGRQFGLRSLDLQFHSGGLPFVAVPDMQIGSMHADSECWPIADPAQPGRASVLQVSQALNPPIRAVPKAEALSAAAAALALAHRCGQLSLAPRRWFLEQAKAVPTGDLARALLDPGLHVQVEVVEGGVEGWWFQVSRRIRFWTSDTPDEPTLLEPLAPVGDGIVLVAQEPMLIVARVTEHPSDWAFAARVWVVDGTRGRRPWQITSQAVHAYGVPILCLDGQTTPEEVVAQILLAAYWHGYLDSHETVAVPPALARAFPRQIARVRTGTDAPSDEAAAVLLFERLVRPGFDPTRGAGSIRHYIARHATTLVRAHRTSELEFHPWDELDISERYYYKLLARFGEKALDGRYEVDDATVAKIRAYLEERKRRKDAMDLLRLRGFGDAAARKWLQRHSIDEIRTAKPRRPGQVQ